VRWIFRLDISAMLRLAIFCPRYSMPAIEMADAVDSLGRGKNSAWCAVLLTRALTEGFSLKYS
jgi:hypothetical protein